MNGIGYEAKLNLANKKFFFGSIGNIIVKKSNNLIIHSSSHINPKIYLPAEVCKSLECSSDFKNYSFHTELVIFDNALDAVWEKLTRLDLLSSFTSAYNLNLGELLSNKVIANLMMLYLKETLLVAEKQGYRKSAYLIMKNIRDLPPSLTTSMQRDINAKLTSEIEYITKGVIDLGESLNLSMMYHKKIYNQILLRA